MIGLIAPNLASVNNWRDLTKVPPAISPWLQNFESLHGRRLNAVICLSGWQERPGNDTILVRATFHLIVPIADPEDVEAERSTPAMDFGNPGHAIEPPTEEPSDGVSLTSIASADWVRPPADDLDEGIRRLRDIESRWTTTPDPVARLSLGDEDDRTAARRFVSDDLYERMTQDERAHLMSLIRAPGTGNRAAVLQYAGSVRRRLNEPEADSAVDDQRRINRINEVVAYVGEDQREFLTALPARDIEHLARRVQLIQISTGDNAAAERSMFRENWRQLIERQQQRDTPPRTAEGVPTQRVARPPTSGRPTGGRAVGRSIPFADIFGPPPRRRRTTENDI